MSTAAIDYKDGVKKQVAEIKFLIHDLRVEKFINNILHFHVTLNTDLEIYNIEQALAFHSDDMAELRRSAADMRKALRDYANAVTNFSPDKTIIITGRRYIETVLKICDLILNPLWGRFDRTITFLPEDSRSVRSRNHYRNNIRWICGVYYRIEYFFQELDNHDSREDFDVGTDIVHYTNNIIYGYIVEKGHNRVEIQIDKGSPAVVRGNRNRFRRMFFNLIMNAVDALVVRPVGMIRVSISTAGDRVKIAVTDNGTGMYPEKVKHVMRERPTLDGELHSLGFVFVRQTVEEFGGEFDIDSEIGQGTTITLSLPYLPDRDPPPQRPSKCQQYAVMPFQDREGGREGVVIREEKPAAAPEPGPDGETDAKTENQTPAEPMDTAAPSPGVQPAGEKPQPSPTVDGDPTIAWDIKDHQRNCGRIVLNDYQRCKAEYPGCIFAIGVDYDNRIDTFQHQPYEQFWNINHEDLSPMLYDATIRGRLEESADKSPELILKEPHNVASYFDLKEIEQGRCAEKYVKMVHDEYILIARKLIATGLAADLTTHITGASRYFPGFESSLGPEPFRLEAIAEQPLAAE